MINIQDLIPFMKDGWVAYEEAEGKWCWFGNIKIQTFADEWQLNSDEEYLYAFDIAPAEDWEKSLIEIKDGKKV